MHMLTVVVTNGSDTQQKEFEYWSLQLTRFPVLWLVCKLKAVAYKNMCVPYYLIRQ